MGIGIVLTEGVHVLGADIFSLQVCRLDPFFSKILVLHLLPSSAIYASTSCICESMEIIDSAVPRRSR